MARDYQWENKGYEVGSSGGGFGYSFAVLLSVIGGVVLFAGMIFGMTQLKIWFGIMEPVEIESQAFSLEQVEISTQSLPESEEEIVVPESESESDLLAEVEELIPELDNTELDLSPEILEPEVALEASIPLDAGEEFGELLEPVAAPQVDHVLSEIGRTENLFEEAAAGQVMIEEGSVKADIVDPDELLKDVVSKGSGGLSEDGLPSGYASIDGLLRMATGELSRSRAALPSDLLFEYDSAQLRETARLGLMKLAMLIDRNPQMYCILEGHSDLFGNGGYNLNLSRQRGQAVKDWLVQSMHLNGNQIVVRAFGSSQPKVEEGTIEEQALNRRVDILMRKDLPVEEPVVIVQEELERPEPPRPQPALPVPEVETVVQDPEPAPQPLRALRVEDDEPEEVRPLRALEINEEESTPRKPLRALPVE